VPANRPALTTVLYDVMQTSLLSGSGSDPKWSWQMRALSPKPPQRSTCCCHLKILQQGNKEAAQGMRARPSPFPLTVHD
jgi:hypothetical protein